MSALGQKRTYLVTQHMMLTWHTVYWAFSDAPSDAAYLFEGSSARGILAIRAGLPSGSVGNARSLLPRPLA